MKKTTTKKLSFHNETLRRLSSDQVKQVAGGGTLHHSTCFTACTRLYTPCAKC